MTQRDNAHHGPHGRRADGDDETCAQPAGRFAARPVPLPAPDEPKNQVALRSPAELADALPYLLGFYPDDSIVVVALHGSRGRFGGRIRIGIPAADDEWPAVSEQVAACLEGEGEAGSGGRRPDGAILFLCQDPEPGRKREEVMKRLRPLAQSLRTACGEREIPVYEALCLSDGHYWSYCCPDAGCCPKEGRPLGGTGTSAMAAAAAYAGIQVRGSLREMERRLTALGGDAAETQRKALDSASSALVPRMLAPDGCAEVRARTLRLASSLMARFGEAVQDQSDSRLADAHDDGLLSDEDAAAMILGLQDRRTRDRAAEWMEAPDCGPALRLWRALARRCVGPYSEHAAAPLTLAGWVAWSSGDRPAARVALDRALRTDPGYMFARLLHRAFNEGVDPEPLRRCMRKEREARRAEEQRGPAGSAACGAP
ncbi:DUF4192 domain-containing protein [Streptomyces sp. HNM0575]|uniref:DUF4192 domain-containing protein n=1 Tax=Streptomyces sp. HNM0575 TaxID=2716338 RepID=UPI00145D8EB9|nr:DUF4192 domain-containing protein [Streptomyces sp. HNM0575]NLU73788.1 DUF4192 domain-containing protein [Streptomyces sp. HNM0575]